MDYWYEKEDSLNLKLANSKENKSPKTFTQPVREANSYLNLLSIFNGQTSSGQCAAASFRFICLMQRLVRIQNICVCKDINIETYTFHIWNVGCIWCVSIFVELESRRISESRRERKWRWYKDSTQVNKMKRFKFYISHDMEKRL